MSQMIIPHRVVRVYDPRMCINEQEYAVLTGASNSGVTWKSLITQSVNNNSITFNAPPPNQGIWIDRKILLSTQVTLNFASGATGAGLTGGISTGNDAFRAFPLASCTNSIAITINNTNINLNTRDVIQALLRYHTPQDAREIEYSLTPSYLDNYQTYDNNGTAFNPPNGPLGPYGNGFYARGGFPMNWQNLGQSGAAGPLYSTVTAVLTEPLFVSPLLFGIGQSMAFIGVQTFDVVINFSDLSRLWSHSLGSPGNTGFAVILPTNVFTNPALLFNYLTPKELDVPIPRALAYPYFNLDRFPTTSTVLLPGVTGGVFGLPGASTVISTQNFMLNSIPRRMYIYAQIPQTNQTVSTADSFIPISNLSVNWNNSAGLLSSCSQQSLYKMSVENGLNVPWNVFTGGPVPVLEESGTSVGLAGAPVCIEMGKDIGLGELEAPGLLGQYQLQMNVTLYNVRPVPITSVTLWILVVSEGSMTILDGRAVTQVGVISKEDVLDAKKAPMVDYNAIERVYGGNFFSGLKAVGSKALGAFKHYLPHIKQALAHAENLSAHAEQLAGEGNRRRAGVLVGNPEDTTRPHMFGGRRMSKGALKKRRVHM
jgi:hypothetical protein